MKKSISSQDGIVRIQTNAGDMVYSKGASSMTAVQPPGKHVSVTVKSSATTVVVALKPSLIAQEERQERLNRSIRLGITPTTSSTKG